MMKRKESLQDISTLDFDPKELVSSIMSEIVEVDVRTEKKAKKSYDPNPLRTFEVVAVDKCSRLIWYKAKGAPLGKTTFDEAGRESFLRGVTGNIEEETSILKTALWGMVGNAPCVVDQNTWGVGLHRIKDGFLLVSGDQAAVIKGDSVEHLSSPVYEGKMIDLQPGNRWIDINELSIRIKALEPLESVYRDLEAFTTKWNWRDPSMASFAAATILSMVTAGMWDVRPWLFLTGRRGSGKTCLLDAIDSIWGSLVARCDKATEAGLRNEIGNTARVAILDEFEKSKHLDSVLEMMKVSSRGGKVTRSSRSGQSKKWNIQSLAIFAGVMVPKKIRTDGAGASRSLVLELLPNHGGGVPTLGLERDQGKRSARVLATLLHHWDDISVLSEKISRTKPETFGVHDSRTIENVSVLLAVLQLSTGKTQKLPSFAKIAETVSDEKNIIEAIGGTIVRDPGYSSRSVLGLLEDLKRDPLKTGVKELLQSHGVALVHSRTGDDFVAFYIPSITRYLLKDMEELRGADITGVLRRTEGAKYKAASFGTSRRKCVLIPWKLFTSQNLDEEDTEKVTLEVTQVTNEVTSEVTSKSLAMTGLPEQSNQVTQKILNNSYTNTSSDSDEIVFNPYPNPIQEERILPEKSGYLVTSGEKVSDSKGSASNPSLKNEVTSEVTSGCLEDISPVDSSPDKDFPCEGVIE